MTERVLVLGGTGEALALAQRLVAQPGIDVTLSLAGRTREPALTSGHVRIGGFGGVPGMIDYLRIHRIDAVVDATHPFAAVISRNAADACEMTSLPRLTLLRPPWRRQAADNWIYVDTLTAASQALAPLDDRVFLAIGRQHIEQFADQANKWFLLRQIDPPETPIPLAHHTLLIGRGPFDSDREMRLLRDHRIDVVISKNSGGDATYGKIKAARELGLPVIMIQRPGPPPGRIVETDEQVLQWLIP